MLKNKKPNSNKKKFNLSFAWAKDLPFLLGALGFCVAGMLIFGILSLVFTKNDGPAHVVFVVLTVVFVCLFVAFNGHIIYNLKKDDKEIDDATSSFLDQINSLDTGRVRLLNKDFRNKSFVDLQKKINNLAAKVNSKGDEEEKFTINDQVYSYEEFPAVLHSCIQASNAFCSAILAVETTVSENVPDNVDDTLFRKIKLMFAPSIICKKKNGSYIFFVERVSTSPAFKTKCNEFVSSFSMTEIKSESDMVTFYGAKLAAATFPYTNEGNLISTVENALKKASPIMIVEEKKDLVLPYPGIADKPRRAILASANETFSKEFLAASNQAEMLDVVKNALKYYCSSMEFTNAGILLYNDYSDTYSLLLEHSTLAKEDDKQGYNLFLANKLIPGEHVNPIFDYVGKDGYYYVDDIDLLPYQISERIQSLGAKSAFFFPMTYQGEKKGVGYFLSNVKKTSQNLLDRESADSFFALVSIMIIAFDKEKGIVHKSNLLNSIAERENKYLYTVDNATYSLIDFSSTFAKKFPEAKKGDICYKAIMGSDSVCAECPLKKGSVKKSITQLGPSEQLMSLLSSKKSLGGNISTVVIETEDRMSSNAGNLYDKSIGVLNSKTLSNEVNKEIRTRGNGIVLALRVTNIDELVTRNHLESKDVLLQNVASLIQEEGYGNILYRYDETSFAFLLKGMNKNAMYAFAEEIASLFGEPLQIDGANLNLKLAYATVNYPKEAQTNFEMISLVGSELKRSSSLGEGLLCEVGRSRVRKANRKEYILQLLQDSLQYNQVSMRLSAVIDTPTRKPISIQFGLGLKGYSNEAISTREFLPVAANANILSSLDLKALNKIKDFYNSYYDTVLKANGVKHLILTTAVETLLTPNFLETVKKITTEADMPKNTLILSIDAQKIAGFEEDLKKVISSAKTLGIAFMANSFDPNIDSVSKMNELGFSYARVSHQVLQSAMASQSANALFIRMAAELDDNKIVPVINNINNQDEAQFCLDLAMPYYVDGGKGYNLTEEDFIAYLNFKR